MEKEEQEEKTHAHDMAICRHLYDFSGNSDTGFDRILTETEFTQFFNSYKPNSKEWQSIECIQTCVKAKLGLGKHIPIHFRAELDINEETQLVNELDKTETATILKQNPPILKYDYQAIGAEYSQQLKDMNLSPKDAETKLDQWLIETSV